MDEPLVSARQPSLCLVDDHPVVREQLAGLLEDAGYQVVASVGTCDEGFAAVSAHEPFAAVIDDNLPDGLGIDLCRRLSVAVPSVKLVVHTGVVEVDLHREALIAGAWAVVPKTVRCTDLLAVLAAGVRHSGLT